jgi:hypothetical protein
MLIPEELRVRGEKVFIAKVEKRKKKAPSNVFLRQKFHLTNFSNAF